MSLTDLIKQLRQETGVGVIEAKKALDASDNDINKAKEELKKSGALAAAKRANRSAKEGIIKTYSHNGRLGVMVEINCETDFVARNESFLSFATDIALHIAAAKPQDIEELMDQDFIKDPSIKISQLLHQIIAKTGEKVEIKRFVLYTLGE
jgi:elongation factor Ts